MIEWIKEIRETTVGGAVSYIIFYLVVVLVGIKISDSLTNRFAKKYTGKTALHWKFMKQVNRIVLIVLGLLGVIYSIPELEKFGTAIVASSSLIVAAIGLASQESLSNAINGMFITMFKPFVVGDRIRLSNLGIVGFIEDINLRHTVLITLENNRLMIPNSVINKENIENFNYEDKKVRNFLDVKIQYNSDIDKAISIFEDIVITHPLFLDIRTEEEKQAGNKPATVFIRNLTESGVELRVGAWASSIDESFKMCSDIRKSLLEKFKEEGIHIATQRVQII